MSGSVNKVILVGNIGKDPESRDTQDGQKVVTLSLATSETWRDKASGERKEKTEWHRVVIFNDRIAEFTERYVSKGRKVFVEGSLQTRKWTDKSGQDRYTTEVVLGRFSGQLVLLDKDQEAQDRQPEPARQVARPNQLGGRSYSSNRELQPAGDDLEDSIPF